MNSRVLRTKEKIVAVRSFEEGYKLCAFDSQHPDNHCTVTFTERKDHQNTSWIAFVFNIEQDRTKNYVLQANDSSLKLVPLTQMNEVDGNQSYWFQKASAGRGDYYSVRTMVSPSRYICIDQSRMAFLFLSDVAERAKVRDEPVRR